MLLRNRSAVRASSTKERLQTKALSAVRFKEGEDCTLWNAHPNSLHCNGQGERKENEGGQCLEIFLGSLSDSIFA